MCLGARLPRCLPRPRPVRPASTRATEHADIPGTLPRMAIRFDLQSHSTHSDGALEAAEVVERAARAGVELLALSDHDTVSGVAEAVRAGERYGVKVVPAVEISALDANARQPRELHILGYGVDH